MSKLSDIRKLIVKEDDESRIEAARLIFKQPPEIKNRQVANGCLLAFVLELLEQDKYEKAAYLLWGDELFSAKPRSVRLIWDQIPLNSKNIVIGAGSLGKSYSSAAWLLLDWLRDPEFTCIKVLSTSKGHAQRNVFAHIKNLHASSYIPLPGERTANSIQVNDDDKQGIHLTAIPQGDDGKGRLRGFHPVPRKKLHPKFGRLSRIRVILDEAEEIPDGVWEDIDNILITIHGFEHIKIFCATNPKDRNSKLGCLCEPIDGWGSINIESSEIWDSKHGWRILRLDGAKCENVLENRLVYPGLLTKAGYDSYLRSGIETPEYFTMARGWFPISNETEYFIPNWMLNEVKGSYQFVGTPIYCASVDLAFQGGDLAIMSLGRFGLIRSFESINGKKLDYPDQNRWGLLLENQFELNKHGGDTIKIGEEIRKICKTYDIPGKWLALDITGSTGTWDYLRNYWDKDVLPVNFSEKATDKKILEEEKFLANQQYNGLVTELWGGMKKFTEHGQLRFAPLVQTIPLYEQLTTRRYKQQGAGLIRVESKPDYKSRGYKSPDYADSLSILVYLVRMSADFKARILPKDPPSGYRNSHSRTSKLDKLEYVDFTND